MRTVLSRNLLLYTTLKGGNNEERVNFKSMDMVVLAGFAENVSAISPMPIKVLPGPAGERCTIQVACGVDSEKGIRQDEVFEPHLRCIPVEVRVLENMTRYISDG